MENAYLWDPEREMPSNVWLIGAIFLLYLLSEHDSFSFSLLPGNTSQYFCFSI